jgi:hypothetical protein
MTTSNLYVDNTMVIVLEDVTDHNDNILTGATVTLSALTDLSGTAVTGVTLPITCTHVSSGKYEGTLPETAVVTAGSTYKGTVTAVNGSDQGTWVETLIAKTRVS